MSFSEILQYYLVNKPLPSHLWALSGRIPTILKGPYPLGDLGVIGVKIWRRRPILAPILAPTILWVWPVDWATGG